MISLEEDLMGGDIFLNELFQRGFGVEGVLGAYDVETIGPNRLMRIDQISTLPIFCREGRKLSGL